MTDSTKYKSIIVRNETHAQLKQLAGKDMKMSGIVSSLVKKEWEKNKNERS